MLLDSTQGLRRLHERVLHFVASGDVEASFAAFTAVDPAPYSELLSGLRVRRSSSPSHLRISTDRWLELSGPDAEVQEFAERLLVTKDGDHHHWYGSPVSLIIEADEERAHDS